MNKKYQERFLRSVGIFDLEQLSCIKSKKIGIAGLGLGGSIFLNLVRLGFEQFHIADPDTNERTNINRQRVAKETTIGLRKDECLEKEAREINPDVQITKFSEGVKSHNVDLFLKEVDWVVDVIDVFAMEDKLMLNIEARKVGIPVSSCATLGFSGSVVVFKQNTPSFESLSGISMKYRHEDNLAHFLQFICPEVPSYMKDQLLKALDKSSYIPFVSPGGEISAAFAATEIVKNILNTGERVLAPTGIFIDAMNLEVVRFLADHRCRSIFDRGLKVA